MISTTACDKSEELVDNPVKIPLLTIPMTLNMKNILKSFIEIFEIMIQYRLTL